MDRRGHIADSRPGRATPLVSVVIPAYNCAAYLGRAIESVLAQGYPNIQCIVVNDGSTDNTLDVARSYGERVEVFDQANAGASEARNVGIAHAAGEFIAFLDADDYWKPSKVEKQVRAFQDFPDLALVTCDFVDHLDNINEPDAVERMAAQPYDQSIVTLYEDFLTLFQDPYLGTPTIMVRASRARDVGGFDAGLTIAEDLDFYFRVCQARPFARINQPLVCIHRRPGTLSYTQPGYQRNLEVIDRLERNYPEFAQAHPNEFELQRLVLYERWAALALVQGEGGMARAILRKSCKHGRIATYHRLYLKSFFVGAIRLIKSLNVFSPVL
jgi:glycosyltransferase involved in cell wall biosynthesis